MALEIKQTERVFQLKSAGKDIKLPDVNPEMSIEEIAEFYSMQYPELLNSVHEKKQSDGKLLVIFKTIAGVKG